MFLITLRGIFNRGASVVRSTNGVAAQTPAFDPKRRLIFLHIPKSAGTTLTAELVRALRPATLVHGIDAALFGGFRDFAAMEPGLRRSIFLSPTAIAADADLAAGHIALSSLRRRYPAGQFMTLLREPITRLLSHWLFWRQQSDADLAAWGGWAARVKTARGTLARFLATPELAGTLDNVGLRLLLWPHPLIPDDGFIDPRSDAALLAQARWALSGFDFADILENPALHDNLRRWLGRPLMCGRLNETVLRRPGAQADLAGELTP